MLLPTLITQTSPQTGRLKSPQKLPYVRVYCELDRRELVGVQGPWFDWRKVTFVVWAFKQDVANVAGAILAVFNRNLGAPGTDANGKPYPTLVYPSGTAKFMSWQEDGEVTMEQDESTKDGQDVWKASIPAKVWSVRPL